MALNAFLDESVATSEKGARLLSVKYIHRNRPAFA